MTNHTVRAVVGFWALGALVVSSEANPPPTVQNSWAGLSGESTNRYDPPDPHGAPGPSGVLATVNEQFAYYAKSGALIWGPVPLWQFFRDNSASTCDGGAKCTDPKAIYDAESGRFYVVMQEERRVVEDLRLTTSFVNVAVSKSSNPASATTADWYLYNIEVTGTATDYPFVTFADYPGIGVDSQALYITFNMFRPLLTMPRAEFYNSQIVIIKKSDLNQGVYPPLVNRRFPPTLDNSLVGVFSLQPAEPVGPSNPGDVAYFVHTPNLTSLPPGCVVGIADRVRLWAVTAPLGSATVHGPADVGGCLHQPGDGGLGIIAPQAGSTVKLSTLPGRCMDAVWFNGAVWLCKTAGQTVDPPICQKEEIDQTRVYWYKVLPNGYPNGVPTLGECGHLPLNPGEWHLQPAIGANPDGDLALVFTSTSASKKPEMMYSVRWSWLSTFEAPRLVVSSPAPYQPFRGQSRWGDYGAVFPDPTDKSLWLTHEWVKRDSVFGWGTWWHNIQDPCGETFCDVTNGPLGDTGAGQGVAWGDYDNDGDQDLYVANDGQANKLLRNDGGCTFTDVTTGPLGDTGPGRGVTWGDYDNDGDLDLFLANGNTVADKLFRNDGNGVFTDVTSGPLGNTGDGTAVSWVDYDLDGDLDLHLVNGGSSSPDKLFRNDGCAGFVDATPSPLADTGNGQAAAWGDYDSDGDPDLYLVKQGNGAQGKNKLFKNNGGGVFVDVSSNPIDDQDAGQAAAWGDYDNDGDLDLVLINNPGTNRLFRNNGGGSFSTVTGVPFTGAGRGVAWADYDNDRDLDLYVTNDGANQLLRNDAGTFVDATQPPLGDTGNGRGVAWADFDRDGYQDLYFANNNGSNKLLRNLGVSNNRWLQVALTGVQSNTTGIGARIRVVAGGVVQIREITGGSGYRSQNSLVAGFGLGSSTIVDTLRVRWPSGVVQVQTQVATNAVATVCEPDTAGVIASSMVAWSESNPDPSYMTLRFRFNATRRATQFEVRYRVGSTGTWLYKTCTGPSSSCLFPCNGNLEAAASYTPCAFTKFQWQARAFNCNGWSAWSPTKLFTAQCLTEP